MVVAFARTSAWVVMPLSRQQHLEGKRIAMACDNIMRHKRVLPACVHNQLEVSHRLDTKLWLQREKKQNDEEGDKEEKKKLI